MFIILVLWHGMTFLTLVGSFKTRFDPQYLPKLQLHKAMCSNCSGWASDGTVSCAVCNKHARRHQGITQVSGLSCLRVNKSCLRLVQPARFCQRRVTDCKPSQYLFLCSLIPHPSRVTESSNPLLPLPKTLPEPEGHHRLVKLLPRRGSWTMILAQAETWYRHG